MFLNVGFILHTHTQYSTRQNFFWSQLFIWFFVICLGSNYHLTISINSHLKKQKNNPRTHVTFHPLVKQTTTRNLYITIYIYFLDGRLCEVGAVRRGIRIVRRWGLNFSMSGDVGRDNAHSVTTREISWTAGSFFLYLLLFNSSALYYLQTPTQR